MNLYSGLEAWQRKNWNSAERVIKEFFAQLRQNSTKLIKPLESFELHWLQAELKWASISLSLELTSLSSSLENRSLSVIHQSLGCGPGWAFPNLVGLRLTWVKLIFKAQGLLSLLFALKWFLGLLKADFFKKTQRRLCFPSTSMTPPFIHKLWNNLISHRNVSLCFSFGCKTLNEKFVYSFHCVVWDVCLNCTRQTWPVQLGAFFKDT